MSTDHFCLSKVPRAPRPQRGLSFIAHMPLQEAPLVGPEWRWGSFSSRWEAPGECEYGMPWLALNTQLSPREEAVVGGGD